MPANEVDAYLTGLEEPKRSTLEALRRPILAVIPGAEEVISYGMPAFRVDGRWSQASRHSRTISPYLPHSGEVLAVLGDRLQGYECTKSSLHFPIDEPLPDDLVSSLVYEKLRILHR